MSGGRDVALSVGVSAVLVVMGVLLAVQLPLSSLAGAVGSPQARPVGHLRVTVLMNNGTGFDGPVAGAPVEVSQVAPNGVHLLLLTNETGEAGFPLPPGEYGVTVTGPQFAVTSSVQVNSGQLTSLQVQVNRFAYPAAFVEAEDPTTQGMIEPWNTVEAEVVDAGTLGLPIGGQVLIISPSGASTPPSNVTFGPTVFLQPLFLHPSGSDSFRLAEGQEVPATVVSQVTADGATWLSLRPARSLQLGGAQYLAVVDYQTGSTVSIAND